MRRSRKAWETKSVVRRVIPAEVRRQDRDPESFDVAQDPEGLEGLVERAGIQDLPLFFQIPLPLSPHLEGEGGVRGRMSVTGQLPDKRQKVSEMRDNYVYNPRDFGGRRSGVDRRHFDYSEHIPERRSGKDRRECLDRRSGGDRRSWEDRRSGVDRRSYEERRIGSLGRRKKGKRRSGQDRRDFTFC
jgi:hypothetical protein